MGRVYNALVKAEKLKADRHAPDDPAFVYGDATARPPAPRFDLVAAKLRADAVKPALSNPSVVTAAAPAAQQLQPTSFPAPELRPLAAAVETGPPAFAEPRRVLTVAELAVAPHLAALTGADPTASERYRALAGKLLNLASGRGLKSVLITSPLEGEGKSTVAINLAWALAKSAAGRVLLIDANADNSSAGRMLGIDCEGGQLDSMIRLDPNGLYVLTLKSMRAGELVKDFEKDFDLIIVDGPAVISNASAQGLAAAVGGVMVVVRAAATHHKDVRSAVKLIPKKQRLGVVLNEAGDYAPAAVGDGNHGFRLGSIFNSIFKRRG